MELKDKLEILIKRNGYKKTDFASAVSITYRALANYISGARTPRAKTLSDMAVLLGRQRGAADGRHCGSYPVRR